MNGPVARWAKRNFFTPSNSQARNDESKRAMSSGVLVRIIVYASAVVLCYLLFRFGKAIWQEWASGTRRDGRIFGRRNDIAYTRLTPRERYEDDEDEGYHDSESLAAQSPNLSLQKALPDKPLPALPGPS